MRDPIIEKWLDKLQDVVEDAEDLFDEIEYDALKFKLEAKSKVQSQKMEKLLERFETFEKQRDILDLQEGVENMLTQRPPSMSTIDDSEFFGREEMMKRNV
ncbi:hypothetical protein CsatA_000423 [Cannabis sativa]